MKAQKTILGATLLAVLVTGTVLLLRKQMFKQRVENTVQSQFDYLFTWELLHNLDLPLRQEQDTLILESAIQPCGNCRAELPVDPSPEDIPFVNKLSILADRKRSPTNGFLLIVDTIRIYGMLNRGIFATSPMRKIYVYVRAEQSRNKSHLNVYENYLRGDMFKQVLKEFEINKKGGWQKVDHHKTK